MSAPDVSVIVLAHRNARRLHRCLTELRSHRAATVFEVVVVANGATDEVRAVLDDHRWVTSVISRANRGFAGGCNLGARHARGADLLFLNDDARVTDGWLDALTHVLDTHPDTGAVSSLVVDEGDTVLEFGSSLTHWSPMSMDRDRHLTDLAHASPRDVQFASGCSLLVRRTVFEEIGGFDESYYPAYFEDADLGLRIRRSGRAVTVTPASVVVHAESSSSTTAQRDIMFQRSERIFRRRWYGELPDEDPPLPRPHAPVVVIDDFAPRAAAGSGLARARQMLHAITGHGHPVLFHAHQRRFELDAELRSRGVRPVDDPERLGDDVAPLCVVVSRPNNLALGERLSGRLGAPLVYDAEARYSARLETLLSLDLPDERRHQVLRQLAEMTEIECRAAVVADVIVTISPIEAQWFTDHGARQVRVVDPFPDPCPVADAGFDERSGAVFIAGWMGGAESPNGDGLRWLASEVMPRVAALDPDLRLSVTGGAPPPELRALASAQMQFLGEVDQLGPLLDRTRVTVCPIRFGAGVKIKAVDSLAAGVPVVTTAIGSEGIDQRWHGGLHITDDPDEFARALVAVTSRRAVWDSMHSPLVDACRSHRSNARAVWGEVLGSLEPPTPGRAALSPPTLSPGAPR